MTFQFKGHCSSMEMYLNNNHPRLYIPRYYDSMTMTTSDKCSSSTFVLSDGLYGKKFFWYISFQLKIQVSVSPALNHCAAREIYVVIIYKWTCIAYIWKMKQDMFEWTIWDSYDARSFYFEDKTNLIELYIFAKSPSDTNITLYPNISPCNQTMHIKDQHGKLPHDITVIDRIRDKIIWRHMYNRGRHNIYCLLFTCYFVHWKMNVSWHSAQNFCKQNNMQLLTMNSDIKAQFIQVILWIYLWRNHLRNPILFLNMKQAYKVYVPLVNKMRT